MSGILAQWVHSAMYLLRIRWNLLLAVTYTTLTPAYSRLMAETVLADDTRDCLYTERNDSVIGPLPTEGYRIFDARPECEFPDFVSRSIFIVVGSQADDDVAQAGDTQVLYTSFPAPSSDNNVSKLLTTTARLAVRHWSLLMLVFVPFGLAAPYIGADDSVVFVLNCLAIIPLADVLCQATDSVASYMGETTGALVNVTMGNLTELVIFM